MSDIKELAELVSSEVPRLAYLRSLSVALCYFSHCCAKKKIADKNNLQEIVSGGTVGRNWRIMVAEA